MFFKRYYLNMSKSKSELIEEIRDYVHDNNEQAITGDGLQEILVDMVDSVPEKSPFSIGEGTGSATLTGSESIVEGNYAVGEGYGVAATGNYSHAEGNGTEASESAAHAEGTNTIAEGYSSHTEGDGTNAIGYASHAEGKDTTATENYSHAEGELTSAEGSHSHVEGHNTVAKNSYEHAEGQFNKSNTVANSSFGDPGNTISSVGIGTGSNDRKNAVEVMQNGDVYVKGVGGYDGTNPGATGIKTLQQSLVSDGYLYEGVAVLTPTQTNPGTPSEKVFYIASEPGTYTNFNNLVVNNGEVAILKYNGTAWNKDIPGIASAAELNQLGQEVEELGNETLPKDIEEQGLYICDKDGKALIRLDILDSNGGFGENLTAAITAMIAEALPEPIIKEVLDDGFYICNEDGEAIAKFANDKWEFLGDVTYQSGVVTKRGDMSNGTEWVISNNAVKHDKRLLFSGKITSFDSLTIGHGKITGNEANWIVITDTNIIEHFVNSGGSEYTGYPKTTPHGLTIENNIQIEIVQAEQEKSNVTIVSSGHSFSLNNITWFGSCGDVYAGTTSTLTDCSLGWTCSKIKSGIWLFGDSYFSLSDSARWTSHLFSNGYNNFMLNAYPGEDSTRALNNLNKLLEIDTPKEIVWCMGMNDPDSSSAVNATWKSKLDDVIAICDEKGIELILATIPTVAGGYNPDTQSYNVGIQKYKNAIVRASGYRYIDFDSAVGANETTGVWFNNGQVDDMLETTQSGSRIHPTSYGALALYQQAIADCPELTR